VCSRGKTYVSFDQIKILLHSIIMKLQGKEGREKGEEEEK